jgi:putative Ca2+/H+ antiporter (TMEM165/GDT1 family)
LEALLKPIFLVAVAETGDKKQFATIALAARFDRLLPVIFGTTFGMMLANIPAVWIGEKLALKTPIKAVRMVTAALFVVMGTLTLRSAFAGTR